LLTPLSAISRRVDDAIKKLRYIDYSLLSREQAARDDEGLVVVNGRVELKSEAMTPGEDGEISQIEWLAAAETVVEKTLEYHGVARSDPLKIHHRNVLEVAMSYEWETARIYDMKTRGLMASDPRHDPSTINLSLVTQANFTYLSAKALAAQQPQLLRAPASSYPSSIHSTLPSAGGSSSSTRRFNPYDQAGRQFRSAKPASRCFRCGVTGHASATCDAKTTTAGLPCASWVKQKSPPPPSRMAPYNFDAPDTDIILRSSDGEDFRAHQDFLLFCPPRFQRMLGLPRHAELPDKLPIVDIAETSGVLRPFLQYLYRESPPWIADLSMWEALYTMAEKYDAEVITVPLKDMLIPRFLDTSPLHVYALASHWALEEEAKIASKGTLRMDIFAELSQTDAELMGHHAKEQLLLLHAQRRNTALGLIASSWPFSKSKNCGCHPVGYEAVFGKLVKRLSTSPWFTVEELFEETAWVDAPHVCGAFCRNSLEDIHGWFSWFLKKMSELPQTV
jgi:hypothetical protein